MHLQLHEVRLCWLIVIVIVNIVIMAPETPSALSGSRTHSLSLSAPGHALAVHEVQRKTQIKTTPTQLRATLAGFV